MVSCRIQIWQILDFEILEDGLGLVVDEYFFHGKGATSGDKVHDRHIKNRAKNAITIMMRKIVTLLEDRW